MTAANYGGDTYTVNGITYDANGNIQTMNRAGVDQLAYRYDDANQSNKLLAVTDASSNTTGFSDGNTSGDDYAYTAEGSLSKDLNRGITDIQYNLLKLPRQLTFNSGKVVQYQYDAGGRKLNMVVTGGEARDYVGPFQYLNNALFEIAHEEGRYSPTGGYEYFHKDHLGNVRVAFNASGITQYTDYDPWGLPLWGGLSGGSSTNRNTFLNREAMPEVGYTDLQARFYDQQIGRFIAVDPVTEEQEMYSTYQYGWNNPVLQSDPNGKCPTCPLGIAGGLIGGLIGGGIEAGMQLYEHGSVTNWAAVGGATAQGAITGGAAGFSGGASLLATGAIGAGANVLGGAASNAIQGKEITAGTVTRDAVIGTGAAVGGALVGKAVASLRTGSVNLEARATTIQNSQPNAVARNRSTTASAEIVNTNGSRQIVVASSRNRLTPAQRSALKSSEREIVGKGHAEATIVNYAESTGASVRRIAASRPICENCQGAIQSTGAKVESPLKRTVNQNN